MPWVTRPPDFFPGAPLTALYTEPQEFPSMHHCFHLIPTELLIYISKPKRKMLELDLRAWNMLGERFPCAL